jgi:hypothetical protein
MYAYSETAELQGTIRRQKEIHKQDSGTGVRCRIRLQPDRVQAGLSHGGVAQAGKGNEGAAEAVR